MLLHFLFLVPLILFYYGIILFLDLALCWTKQFCQLICPWDTRAVFCLFLYLKLCLNFFTVHVELILSFFLKLLLQHLFLLLLSLCLFLFECWALTTLPCIFCSSTMITSTLLIERVHLIIRWLCEIWILLSIIISNLRLFCTSTINLFKKLFMSFYFESFVLQFSFFSLSPVVIILFPTYIILVVVVKHDDLA